MDVRSGGYRGAMSRRVRGGGSLTSFFNVHAEPVAEGVVRVPVVGEVDLATSDLLFDALVSVLSDEETEQVEVDVREVTLLDASGIGVLLAARNHARARGKDLRMYGASGLPLNVLEVTGVLGVLGGKPDDPGPGAAHRASEAGGDTVCPCGRRRHRHISGRRRPRGMVD
jgi:anti-anti-sigma factor